MRKVYIIRHNSLLSVGDAQAMLRHTQTHNLKNSKIAKNKKKKRTLTHSAYSSNGSSNGSTNSVFTRWMCASVAVAVDTRCA